MNKLDVIIVGAGAAGLMCAIETAKKGLSVLILEKSEKPGKKILISGGGRCNFTNMQISHENYISHNTHFCKSALSRYTQWDFMNLIESHQLTWTEKKLGQLFCDQKAPAILQLLLDQCQQANVKITCDCDIQSIQHDDIYTLKTNIGTFTTQSLVIATGGPSIPKMGATSFALQVAKQFNIKNYPFRPALVPLLLSENDLNEVCRDLSGVSLSASVSTEQQSFSEDILFTHKGLSGPAILQISSYLKAGDELQIDLLPNENCLSYLQQLQTKQPKILLSTALTTILPKRLANRLCEVWFDNQPLNQIQSKKLQIIADKLNAWKLTPAGNQGMRIAEVCTGGVNCNELSSKTFESKQPGLYFIGEAVDVTGHLGGYNFQWAWSSGWCAGQAIPS